jgi:hypothetical protein
MHEIGSQPNDYSEKIIKGLKDYIFGKKSNKMRT